MEIADHLPPDLEMGLDDDAAEGDDDPRGGLRAPLPPDDRLWRHPSELATTGLPAAARPRPPAHHRAQRVAEPAGYGQRLVAVGLAGVVGALLTASTLVATGRLSRGPSVAQQSVSTSSVVTVGSTAPSGVAALVARAQPAVLAVQASRANTAPTRGSALVIQSGYAVTALRVVDGAASVVVRVDGSPYEARVIGSDPETDLALLAFDGVRTDAPPLGSSATLRPGDVAVTVSAPPSVSGGHSTTVGVVSAVDRTMSNGKTVVRGVLQLDRPVPAEGAGGALLDSTGNVVGITLPAPDATAPMGYAIPIDAVNDVSRQLLQSGHVSRPWLGIDGGDDDAVAGAKVLQVKAGSPAARAGVQVGDVVTALDGTGLVSMDDMLRLLRAHAPGDTVRLTIVRNGKPTDLLVTLAPK